jgi:hypothetical protein
MPLIRQADGAGSRWGWVRRFVVGAALAVTATVGQAAAAQSGSELRGRVVTESGTPVSGATVTLTSLRFSVRTDSAGHFVLKGTPGGTLELSISADGYRTESASVVLGRGRPVNRDFVLASEGTPAPETVGGVRYLRGQVTDETGSPLAFANIQLNGGRRYVSNDSGRFTIPVSVTGRLSLLARRIGFEAVELALDSLTESPVTLRMQSVAVALPARQVTARSPFVNLDLRGFYRRMADAEKGLNFGHYITPEDLEFRKPVNLTDAVEQLPNIRIRPGNAETTMSEMGARALANARNMRIEDRQGCPLTVYLDGVRIQPLFRASGQLQDERVNTIIQPGSVAGIEVYTRGLSAPAEYQPLASTCGIVLIWTR